MSLIIEKKYKIISNLGKGSFGLIFKGINLITNEFVAIKIEKKSDKSTLRNEAKIYNYLYKTDGIPRLRTYGSEGQYNYLIIDLLSISLDKLRTSRPELFTSKLVMMLGIQMIQRIEDIHNKGIIHRDIKPENFIYNHSDAKLYIIDFGIAKRFLLPNNKHCKITENNSVVGTMNYISIHIHNGYTPSRRDDLESIFYVLLYLIKGKLPWDCICTEQDNESSRQILREKMNINYTTDDKHLDLPYNLLLFLKYCRQLSFYETPDYKLIKSLLNTR